MNAYTRSRFALLPLMMQAAPATLKKPSSGFAIATGYPWSTNDFHEEGRSTVMRASPAFMASARRVRFSTKEWMLGLSSASLGQAGDRLSRLPPLRRAAITTNIRVWVTVTGGAIILPRKRGSHSSRHDLGGGLTNFSLYII